MSTSLPETYLCVTYLSVEMGMTSHDLGVKHLGLCHSVELVRVQMFQEKHVQGSI